MRTATTVAGVTLAGAALSTLAYGAVASAGQDSSAQSDTADVIPTATSTSSAGDADDSTSSATPVPEATSTTSSGSQSAADCLPPARVIGADCVTVLHVKADGSPVVDVSSSAAPMFVGDDDAFDDHGGDRDDDVRDDGRGHDAFDDHGGDRDDHDDESGDDD